MKIDYLKKKIKKIIGIVDFAKRKARKVFLKYKDFTMIPESVYIDNLFLTNSVQHIDGCIVECGVWRGGMIAGIYDYIDKKRECILFDSFEGLPDVKPVDGLAAKKWQLENDGVGLDNCKAEMHFAEKAMELAKSKKHKIVKGWFDQTIPSIEINEPIAILRLDADWYDSTMTCLENLYPRVADNGIIIIDDYYSWDGCSKALHDYLSKNSLPVRIRQTKNGVAYIINTKGGRKL